MEIENLVGSSSFFLKYVIYFIPGLIAIKIYDYLTFSRIKLTFKEILFYSGLLTTIVYGVISFVWIYDFQASVIVTFVILIGTSFCIGKIKRRFFQKDQIRPNTWQRFLEQNIAFYVRVRTNDNKNVFGILKTADWYPDENYDIILKNPYIYDNDNKEQSLGSQMYIPRKSISSITNVSFLDTKSSE